MNEPAVYTVPQVAELLGTTTDRVYQLAREDKIPHVTLGARSVRIPRRSFHAWLDKNLVVESTTQAMGH